MDLAMAHLDAQKELNYAEAAKLFGIPLSTLARRYRGKQTTRAEAASTYCAALNNVQEDTLLGCIDALSELALSDCASLMQSGL
jgi:helix-turn-helix, Psq domain